MEKAKSNTPPKKKRKRLWPYILLMMCLLGAALAGAMFASDSLVSKVPPAKKEVKETELITAHDKATIMLLGVDERVDDVGRSDTLMVATIDPDLDKAALLSIPRDTRVKIQGHGYDKINAAYAFGGERLTERTVENFLGVTINHYVIINTRSFKRIIDALDGIDIEVEKRMYYEDPWDDDGGLIIDLQPGIQHMNGKTAVTYVRYRDEEGDIGRIRRQQKFMRAVIDKVTSPTVIPKLPTVISEVIDAVKTDLSVRQILEFIGTLKNAQRNGLEAEMVPGRPLYIDGVSYWIPDINKLRTALADTLGVTMSRTMMNVLEREAKEYENSIPAHATEVPADDNSIGKAVTDVRSSSLQRPSPKTNSTTRRDTESSSPKETAPTTQPKPIEDDEPTARTEQPPVVDMPAPPANNVENKPSANQADSKDVPSPDFSEGKMQ